MKERRIFYSWQSDDVSTAKHIEECLKSAILQLQLELDTNNEEIRLILDRDTHGVSGAPDITSTIIAKIKQASIFVADVSIVGEYNNGKKVVNQNVMFELGYAIAQKTADLVVMLFNKDEGRAKDLPFDISHHRVTSFTIKGDRDGEELKTALLNVLRPMLKNCELAEKIPIDSQLKLNKNQEAILDFFFTFNDAGRLRAIQTMAGYRFHVIATKYDNIKLGTLIRNIGAQRLVAELDDLVRKNALSMDRDERDRVYELAKEGFTYIEKREPRIVRR